MSNIRGLFDGKKDADSDDDSKGSNNRFVGGISSQGGGSGLAVQPNFDEEGGGGPSGRSTQDSIFNLAEDAASAGGENGDGSVEAVRRTITMYRDGFVVDDGPYRRLDDPANATFLRHLAMGKTPPELVEDAGSSGITVGLIDKRSEEYVETFRSFSGAGNTLGGAGTASASATGSTVGVFDPATLPETPPVNESQPTTTIAVRLPNGQRKVVKVNLSMTVLEVATHIRPMMPDPTPFRLVAGFPPKPLEDSTATVEAAGLKGAQIQVKNA
ncbi:SEP domain containing protein [Nitzschia inconspicua]|uniref:SEP domain containing protein n=1 Tax=Nitzschia inconspicua TaxID=303405 RepID=A0A9K3PTR4_9STRA|nr:SEP domain containing protein [Nitzschia inconspicua]